MYGMFACIWLKLVVNVSQYSIHGARRSVIETCLSILFSLGEVIFEDMSQCGRTLDSQCHIR